MRSMAVVLAWRCLYFFFQAEDGIRDLVRSRGLGDVYKRQRLVCGILGLQLEPLRIREICHVVSDATLGWSSSKSIVYVRVQVVTCLLYTSDAADERSSVDLGGRRIIKKKKHIQLREIHIKHNKTTIKDN